MRVIRKPKLTEVAAIKHLIDTAAEQGAVLRRPLMELYENVRDFYTYVDEAGVGGCCALHIDMVDLGEIRSLVVRSDLRGQGIGERLLDACLEEARGLNITRIYALTRNRSFFEGHGFQEVDKHELPHKVFDDCVRCPLFPDCDEIAMTRTLEGASNAALPGKEGLVQNRVLPATLGFLGFGNMGAAIARGLLNTGTLPADRIVVYDEIEDKRREAAALGLRVAASPGELAGQCGALLLAVKPQSMPEALDQIKPGLKPKTLILSIAAGISISYLQGRLGRRIKVVRIMPNTPALVKTGAAGIALSGNCGEKEAAVARVICEAIGIAEMVPEPLMDAVTALSGSGPAYFFYLVECLVAAAVKHGLSEEQATRLAVQTLAGAGRLLQESGESASALRGRVTSKGGTTAAALDAFRKGHFERVVADAVGAAVARSKELGK